MNKKLFVFAGIFLTLLTINVASAYSYGYDDHDNYRNYYGNYYGKDSFETKSFSYTQSRGYGEHVYYMKTTGLSKVYSEGFDNYGNYHTTTAYVKTTSEKPNYYNYGGHYAEGYYGYGPAPVYKYYYPRSNYYFSY